MALSNEWLGYSPREWERWDMSEPILRSADMSPEEAKELCDDTYRLFLSPKYVLGSLMSARSLEDLAFAFRGTRKVVGHIRDFN